MRPTLSLLLLAPLALHAEKQNSAIVPMTTHQPARHSLVIAENQRVSPELIFIGDSITHQFGGARAPGDSTNPYGQAEWDRLYAPRKAVNMGFSGEKTGMMLWRLRNGELDGIKPKVAVILAGTNNIGSHNGTAPNTPAEAAEGVLAIAMEVHKKCPDTKVLLLAMFPRHHGKDTPVEVAFPSKANTLLANDAKKYPWITYIDLNDKLLSNGKPDPKLFYDGLHPNAAGYIVWAEAMEPTLSKLMGDYR